MTLRSFLLPSRRLYLGLWALSSALVLAGCASSKGGRLNQAPVEDRGTAVKKAPPISGSSAPSASITKPLGFENEGKLGYYTVKEGDTLIRVGLDHGQNWRDIARWNQLDRPSQIEVGQVLRVLPPVNAGPVAVPTPVPMQGARPAANVKPAGDEDSDWVVDNDFRQIMLVRNIQDSANGTIYTGNTGNALKMMNVSSINSAFTRDQTIIGQTSGAKAVVDTLDANSLFYHQYEKPVPQYLVLFLELHLLQYLL